MIAVPHRVILEYELTREWRVGVQGHRGGPIEILVAERPDHRRSRRAVVPEQLQRRFLRHGVVLLGVRGIQLVDGIPGHSRYGVPLGQRLGELDLERVHGGDVVHHHADLAPVLRDTGLPLGIGEGLRECGERAGTLLEANGEGVRAVLFSGGPATRDVKGLGKVRDHGQRVARE